MKNIRHLIDPEVWERGQKLCALKPWFFRLFSHGDWVQYWALRVLKSNPDVDLKLEYLLEPDDYALFDSDREARRKVPDFIIEFDDQKQIAFEVELHPKSSEAYSTIFMNMFGRRKCPVVYFVRTQAIKSKVQKIAGSWVASRRTDPTKYPLMVFVKTFDEVKADDHFHPAMQEALDYLMTCL